MKKRWLLFIIISFCVGLSVVQTRPKAIAVVGPPLVQPLLEKMASQFKKTHPQIEILISKEESDAALASVISKKVHIALMSHAFTSEQLQLYAPLRIKTISLARDALIPIVSFEVFMSGVRSLSLKDIERIYKGQITNWAAVGGSSDTIVTFDLADAHPTRTTYMSYVFDGYRPDSTGVKNVYPNEEEMALAVAQSTSALAYASSSVTSTKVRGLGIKVNGGPVLYPTRENILSETYPLTRNILIVVCGELSIPEKEFLNTLISPEGQRVLVEEHLVPLIDY